MKQTYKTNKETKVGVECVCPSCGTNFIKQTYQQAFCRTKSGTVCKDKYWNIVTPTKRNNTTRISPASARYMERRRIHDYDDDHPFSSDGLGQR
jgi:signal recognition particle receptor subunit beta